MTFSVMITTRDRCADLQLTCEKLSLLQPPPDEVILCADGATDDTTAMVLAGYPQFKLIENSAPIGSIPSRDRMLRMATGDIVLSLDDDSYPMATDFLARASAIFASHPEAAVVVFPELRDGGAFSTENKSDSTSGHYVSAYANCSAAMRRELYGKIANYVPFFSHGYEEPDYALQCYAAGYAIWFEPSLTIRHHFTPRQRNMRSRHRLVARNELWSVWLRCPFSWMAIVSAFRVFRQFQYAASQGVSWIIREPVWWLLALRGLPKCLVCRKPLPWKTYHAWMRLSRHPISNVTDLRQVFKPADRT